MFQSAAPPPTSQDAFRADSAETRFTDSAIEMAFRFVAIRPGECGEPAEFMGKQLLWARNDGSPRH
jgi:hypothetical protein